MRVKTIRDADVRGKKILVRVDYNVPLSKTGEVEDATRIEETLPTLKYLLTHGASLILISHLGRPKGKADLQFSLRGVAKALETLLGQKVEFAEECVGVKAEEAAANLQPGHVLMLENLRFHPEEEANRESFAKALASLGDVYVNDAFGASHRAHASIAGIPKFKPAFAGFLVEKEIDALSSLREHPHRPYFAILGGAKISDKLGVIKELLTRVDGLLIGGAMAFTFLKAQGYGVGKSLVDDNFVEEAANILKTHLEKVKLPVDCLAAPFEGTSKGPVPAPSEAHPVSFSKNRDEMKDLRGFDIGPQSIQEYTGLIANKKPRTVFWNGPMGVFEVPEFAKGTLGIAKALGQCARNGAQVVVGGGDSVAAVNKLGLAREMTHLSTGGGASLEFLEGKILPGIAALQATSSVSKT